MKSANPNKLTTAVTERRNELVSIRRLWRFDLVTGWKKQQQCPNYPQDRIVVLWISPVLNDACVFLCRLYIRVHSERWSEGPRRF